MIVRVQVRGSKRARPPCCPPRGQRCHTRGESEESTLALNTGQMSPVVQKQGISVQVTK